VVPGAPGRVVVGIEYDNRRDRLFAAGGATGRAFVFDASTGATLATYQLATGGGTFVNDVVVTKDAAYFTDSFRAVLYRVPLARNGALADPGAVQVLPLTGDFALRPGFNANGIDATPNGKELVIVQSGTGFLFRVDPETGVTTRIDLGGATLPNGDGILLEGRTLYVVQNQLNRVAVVRLAPDLASGTVEGFITDADFRVPTTVARIGNALYLPNARFGTPPGPNVDYEVVRVER
jgi:sugar lactone lactonase YvrE